LGRRIFAENLLALFTAREAAASLALVVFVSNLVTGAALGRRPSGGGISAIAPLTALWLLGWLIWPLFAMRLHFWASSPTWYGFLPSVGQAPSAILWAALIFPFLYLLPLLLGAIAAQRRVAPPSDHAESLS